MEPLKTALLQFNDALQATDLEALWPHVRLQSLKKGDYLLRSGQTAQWLYFIDQGAIKCFSERRDRIIWAEFEGHFIAIPYSFNAQVPSKEALICLQDARLYAIHHRPLFELYATNLNWATWGRKFSEHWIQVIEQIYTLQTLPSATAKYQTLIDWYPSILQQVSLKDIASFLGISPVSVSRIRANTQVKPKN